MNSGHSSIQEIVALFGHPVAGNPTQYMMSKAFAQAKLDWRYLTLEVAPEHLSDAIRGMRAMGFRGCSLTAPHMAAVLPLLDDASKSARLVGAANCVLRDNNLLVGQNTVGQGFVQTLRQLLDPAGQKIVVLGAGDTAKAIAVELGLAGAAEITIVNRTPERGEQLASLVDKEVGVPGRYLPWEGDFQVPADAAVLVNATSIGSGSPSDRAPVAADSLRSDLVVADVVLNPPQTALLAEARGRGCRTLDGLALFVNQTALAYQTWTGTEPDLTVMREALEEFLEL